MFRTAGASIALTSLCNLIAFSVGSTYPLPVVASFSLTAAIAVTINFFVIFFGFGAAIALDARRQAANRPDCCPCLGSRKTAQEAEKQVQPYH